MLGRPASSPSPEPRAARHKVFLPAELTGADGAVRVHLLNLSSTGALIHAEVPPIPGMTVRMRCGGATWSARVMWTQGKRFGIMNQTPLTPAQTAALVAGQAK